MRSSPRSTLESSALPLPELSPLEPLGEYSRRMKKWRLDNAKWEGQKRALERLDKKETRVPTTPDPTMFP